MGAVGGSYIYIKYTQQMKEGGKAKEGDTQLYNMYMIRCALGIDVTFLCGSLRKRGRQ